jgi:hypothetical protein
MGNKVKLLNLNMTKCPDNPLGIDFGYLTVN